MSRHNVAFRLGGDAPVERLAKGRDGWALLQLVRAGDTGITTLQSPAPRWSHYIWKLRGMGVTIETITEGHGGDFAGHHARYVLRSPVEILEA